MSLFTSLGTFFSKFVSSSPIETKVAGSATAGVVATAVIDLIHTYGPGVQLPSTGTMVLIVTFLMGAVGYLLPHSNPTKSVPAPVAPAPAPVVLAAPVVAPVVDGAPAGN